MVPPLIRIIALLSAVAAFLTLPVREPALAAPTVSQFTLSNGLAVVVIPDRRTPVVTHMLWSAQPTSRPASPASRISSNT
jgi:hypothetical protein